jgi:hypothetical protein
VNAEQASKDQIAGADLAVFQGRPPSSGEEAIDAPLGPAGVTTLRAVPASACLREEIDRNTGNPDGERSWLSTRTP